MKRATAVAKPPSVSGFQFIPTSVLRESELNPRKHYDQAKLEDLAASVRTHGIITPLLVRETWSQVADRPGALAPQYYEIAAGHRRYRAAQLAGLAELQAADVDAFLKTLVALGPDPISWFPDEEDHRQRLENQEGSNAQT